MHPSVHKWVAVQEATWGLAGSATLDVGAFDVNGNVRDLFGVGYVGLDMRPGPNVDVVANSHNLPYPDGGFDTVLSLEHLEHDTEFWTSCVEMGRVLKPGGRLLITTRGIGFPLHEFPHDLWRFTAAAGDRLLDMAGCDGTVTDDPEEPGIFCCGVRR